MSTFRTDDSAACRRPGVNPEWWFDESPERAKDICNGKGLNPRPCPFLAGCLEYGLHNREDGVWGGLSERQRQTLARKNGWEYARPKLTGLVVYGPARVIPHGTSVGVENHRRHYMPLCDACLEFDERRKDVAS